MEVLIGIVPDYQKEPEEQYGLRSLYAESVFRAGGVPLILPYVGCVEEFTGLCSGFLFTGGGHAVDPLWYGAEQCGPLPLNPMRTGFEKILWTSIVQKRLPILGICAGMQWINVMRGGSLHQYLPSSHPNGVQHHFCDKQIAAHSLTIAPGTHLARLAKGEMETRVNSSHFQAVDRLGAGLCISAVAEDGIIEAIEAVDYPFCMGVQWHPEFSVSSCDTKIFQGFVQAARDALSDVRVKVVS